MHYKAWKRGIDVVMRQEHKAGEKLFVDFPGQKIPIYDARTGQVALQAELFVAAMGASTSCTPKRWCPRSSCTGSPPTCTPLKP